MVIQDGPDAGKEEQVFFHDRSIGGQRHSFRKSDSEGSDNEEIEKLEAVLNNMKSGGCRLDLTL